MKYLLTALLTGFIALSFIDHKCDHVYTSVEQSEVKVDASITSSAIGYVLPTGKQQGKELICVKCFNKVRQVVDYGQPCPQSLTWPQGISRNASPCCDTLFYKSTGWLLGVDSGSSIHFINNN